MEPVRIKYWGMCWLTRRTYLILTFLAGLGVAALIAVLAANDVLPAFSWPWEPRPRTNLPGVPGVLFEHCWTIIVVCVLAEMIDIVVTLRTFARKEAEMRNELTRPTSPKS